MKTTTVNPADFDDFDAYCDALRGQKSLTPSEYAALLQQSIAYGEEHHFETLSQYQSECALFGDAGPGQGIAVGQIAQMLHRDRAHLARVQRIAANLGA